MTLSRTTSVAAIAAVALAGAGCGHAPGRADHLLRSHRIEIEGASALDRDLVASRVDVAWPGIAPDVHRVEQLYASAGYLGAKVDVVRLDGGAGAPRFRVRIFEGSLARVVQLTLDGVDGVPEARLWNVAFPLQVGRAYSAAATEQTLEVLAAALRGAGYSTPEVLAAAHVDRDTLEVRVGIRVTPGPHGDRYRFGPLLVTGTSPAASARIHRAVEPLLPRGEPFDVTRLEAVRQRVLAAGAFDRAAVKPGSAQETMGEIPVVVSVRDAR